MPIRRSAGRPWLGRLCLVTASAVTAAVPLAGAAAAVSPTAQPASVVARAGAIRGAQGFDYNGDGRADIAVFRPTTGEWFVRGQAAFHYGTEFDQPVVGDFTGEGASDPAVVRTEPGGRGVLTWYIQGVGKFRWGVSGDVPVPADYNGDGVTEIAVYHPSNSTWYVRGLGSFVWGKPRRDRALAADYDGDGQAEATVWRDNPLDGSWHVRGRGAPYRWTTDGYLLPADYNGDNTAEPATWNNRTGTWHIKGQPAVRWGVGTDARFDADIPVTGDYDGDGAADIAVWRRLGGTWYIRGVETVQYGISGDVAVSGATPR